MKNQYTRAPHVEAPAPSSTSSAPNAALLIDFDNVTMGIRSDLSKELKSLLNSDIIKGKVTVQRAYADWRRYPQYIVPLSEASVDLIFAPAYGSSKKNATDIRMAIDGMELVFIRPEIGTFILLTGDSDFSSLVLKLKEYGKFVIGVGIQESSSDILVQNCDEYYSYSSLTGLRKASADDRKPMDPWQLVERAVQKMVQRGDVMRSDRLKQVMLEMDPAFEESSFGFSKFSKFVAEASSRGLLKLRKLENGQYEVSAGSGAEGGKAETAPPPSGRRERRLPRGRGRRESAADRPVPEDDGGPQKDGDPLQAAYGLLREALGSMRTGRGSARDSDVKRRMLAIDSSFDEAELGFSKFSKFLQQAHDHEVVEVEKRESGNYHVHLPGSPPGSAPEGQPTTDLPVGEEGNETGDFGRDRAPEKQSERTGRTLSPRVSRWRTSGQDESPPPLLEGQAVGGPVVDQSGTASTRDDGRGAGGRSPRSPRQRMRRQRERASGLEHDVSAAAASPTTTESHDLVGRPSSDATANDRPGGASSINLAELGLPSGSESVLRYLTNSYKGVGKKTAESLVEAFGDRIFQVLHESPDELARVIPANRAEKLVEAWQADFARRSKSGSEAGAGDGGGRGRRRPGIGSGRRGGGRRASRSD